MSSEQVARVVETKMEATRVVVEKPVTKTVFRTVEKTVPQNNPMSDFISQRPAVAETFSTWMDQPEREMVLVPKTRELALSGTPDAVIEFLSELNRVETDDERRGIMTDALLLNNPEASAVLLEALRSTTDPYIQSVAKRALCNMADESLLYEVSERFYASSDVWEKENLAGVVRQIENKALIPVMAEILAESDLEHPDSLTQMMLEALTDMHTPESEAYLRDLFPVAQL